MLFPGTPNDDSGPDFLNARVRIGSALWSGSVELHRDASDWTTHRHHQDDRYNDVILHVVLSAGAGASNRTSSGRLLPILPLDRHLDGATLTHHTRPSPPVPIGDAQRLPCACVNALVPSDLLLGWLTRLGTERLERKSLRWGHRLVAMLDELREPGAEFPGAIPNRLPSPSRRGDFVSPVLWDQALYEALLEGLGYAKNRCAFQMLARTVPLASLRRIGLDHTLDVLAVLFGASRLLPNPGTLADPLAQRHAAVLRDRWTALSCIFPSSTLCASDWLFFRLRPANFPTARIAAFAHALPVIFRAGFRGCLDILRAGAPAERMVHQLRNILIVRAGGIWRYRTAFEGPAGGRGSAIGRSRATELIINAILPLALRFADTFGEPGLTAAIQTIVWNQSAIPRPRLLSRMHQDLLHGRCAVNSPLLYQGAIELYVRFCSKLRCRSCAVGAACGFVTSSAVSSWRQERGCC